MRIVGIFFLLLMLSGAACAQHVTIVANSIDLPFASGFIDNLRIAGVNVQTISASELESHRNDSNIFILGGQNAPEGIGPVASSILNDWEKAQVISQPEARLQVIALNVWAKNQKVRVFAGYEKEQTRLLLSESLSDIVRGMKFNDSTYPQNFTGVIVPAPQLNPSQPFTEVDANQANAIIKNIPGVVVIDVRGRELYALGHIPGAINMPVRNIAQNLGALDNQKTYLLYCGGNSESILAGNLLHESGFKNIYRIVDGYVAWRKAGYPKEKSA